MKSTAHLFIFSLVMACGFIIGSNMVAVAQPESTTTVTTRVDSGSFFDASNEPIIPEKKPLHNQSLRLTEREYTLSLFILGFGFMVICVIFFAGRRDNISYDYIFKLTSVTLVIVSSLFLVIAGYSSEQIAPVIGLLGTISGYLLGKASSTAPQNDKNNETK